MICCQRASGPLLLTLTEGSPGGLQALNSGHAENRRRCEGNKDYLQKRDCILVSPTDAGGLCKAHGFRKGRQMLHGWLSGIVEEVLEQRRRLPLQAEQLLTQAFQTMFDELQPFVVLLKKNGLPSISKLGHHDDRRLTGRQPTVL